MSIFKLNLPTGIRWKRICVTEDMIDPEVCDERLPAKRHSSMAVYKFNPEDEYPLDVPLNKYPFFMNFERKSQQTDLALANATLPSKQDTYVERKVRLNVNYGPFGTDEIYYKHYTKTALSTEVYQAPDGYRIVNYHDLIHSNTGNAYSSVTTSFDGKSITIQSKAISSIWFRDDGARLSIDNYPDTLDEHPARAERRLQVNLISEAPIKQIG